MSGAAKALFGLLGSAVIAGALWFVVHLIQQAPVQQAKAAAAQDQALVAKGQGDLNTQAAQIAATNTVQLQPIYQREKETEHAIEIAPGSDTLVNPRSAGAFLGGLCGQPWRAADPGCRPDDPGGRQPAGEVPTPALAP